MAKLPDGDPAPCDGSLPPAALDATRPLSIYLHVPFCLTRCGYCDFNTYTPSELSGGMDSAGYLAAAVAELDLARRVLGPRRVETVFFGGGTPTLLPPASLIGLLEAVGQRFELAEDAEVTTEANPESLSFDYLAELRLGGFTRLSLGMQSLSEHVLAVLERQHRPGRALDAAQWAKEAGFEHISLDLIYGTPGESLTDWRTSLEAATAVPVDHVSAYSLIVEDGTRLAARVRRGELPAPNEDDLADKYLLAEEFLSAHGFANYEVSNWAKPGGQCRHNLRYWLGGDWWGIGPGAHSHINGVRFWNRKHPRSYAAKLAQGHSPALAREVLDADARHLERILLQLRLAEGVALDALSPSERARIPALPDRLARLDGDRLVLTTAGRLLADGIIRDLAD